MNVQRKFYDFVEVFKMDYKNNSKNPKAIIVLSLFRIAGLANTNKFFFIFFIPYLVFYRIFVEWLLCIEIPYKTKIGAGLRLDHGQALVINDGSTIGSNCTIRHSTTIGSKLLKNGTYSRSPVLGNFVDVGSNVCIIGPIKVGNNVKIGAGAVVICDLPDNCIAVGNPARIIGK